MRRGLLVDDEGDGHQPEIRTRIFTKFWKHGTARRLRAGLYIVDGLVTAPRRLGRVEDVARRRRAAEHPVAAMATADGRPEYPASSLRTRSPGRTPVPRLRLRSAPALPPAPARSNAPHARHGRQPMSGPNTDYDPVEVTPLHAEEVEADARRGDRRDRGRRATSTSSSRSGSRTRATGPRWRWPTARSARCRRRPARRPASGSARPAARSTRRSPRARSELEAEHEERMLVEETVDVTLPYDRAPQGARHPLTTLMERIGDVFVAMGWEVAEGPEVEAEWLNFDALNLGRGPPGPLHAGHVLPRARGRRRRAAHAHVAGPGAQHARPATPPIYVICPGRTFRTDELDATHTPGLPPGRGARGRQGPDDGPPQGHPRPLRRRRCSATASRPGSGRRTSRSPSRPPRSTWSASSAAASARRRVLPHLPGEGWIEWGGCGVVNPRVLRRLRHRPRGLLRLRLRHGHRAHADVPPRRRGHARHGRGRRALHPAFGTEL